MRIVTAPDPVLRTVCEPVDPSEIAGLRELAEAMAELMYKSSGCGIAAPQVGISKRLIVVDCTVPEEEEEFVPQPVFCINPVITWRSDEKEEGAEGCLSIPGLSVPITRDLEIVVEALNLAGELFEIRAEGFCARAYQHEIDHLDGVTMFEHLDPIGRIEAFKEYEAAVCGGAKPGDTNTSGAADKRTSVE